MDTDGCTTVAFEVPGREATGLTDGQWVWDLAGWDGVTEASLDGTLALLGGGCGYLTVTATPAALARVRAFCRERGFAEVA